ILGSRFLRRDVGELEQAERVGRRVHLARVDLLPWAQAGEPPGSVLAAALDPPAAAGRIAHLQRLHLLDLEGAAVDPFRTARRDLRQRVGDHVDRARVARQGDKAAVSRGTLWILGLAFEELLADHQLGERLAGRAAELDTRAGTV